MAPKKKKKVSSESQLTLQVRQIFMEAQMHSGNHQKNAQLLKKLSEKVKPAVFMDSLEETLRAILLMEFKVFNKYAERLTTFLSLFCSSLTPTINDDEMMEHPLFCKIIEFLLSVLEANSDVVRYRACDIILRILESLIHSELSGEMCDKIEEPMLKRIHDIRVPIRLKAITVVQRLQDHTRQDDPIIKEFSNLIYDDNPKIRKLCIEKIVCRRDVLPLIMSKILDVDVNVRLAAYKRISKIAAGLKIVDKQFIIKCGFLDSDKIVVDYVSKTVVTEWLDHYKGDFLRLMKAVRLDANEKDLEDTVYTAEKILEALFSERSNDEIKSAIIEMNNERLIQFDKLNYESALFWRIVVQHLRKDDDLEESTNEILPEPIFFCKYIKEYCSSWPSNPTRMEQLEGQFILKQLLIISKGFDFVDTCSRDNLNSTIKFLLENYDLSTDVIEEAIHNIEKSIPDTESRISYITDIIYELIYPTPADESENVEPELDRTLKFHQLKLERHILEEDLEEALSEQDYLRADELKSKIGELGKQINATKSKSVIPTSEKDPQKRTDTRTMLKYLDTAAAMMLSPNINKPYPKIEHLMNNTVLEVLIHDNYSIRAKAMRCYSLYCILDKKLAYTGIHIFSAPIFGYKAGQEFHTETLLVCIKAVVDLIRLFGSNLMSQPPNNDNSSEQEETQRIFTGGTSLTELLQGLVDLMDDESLEIQKTACRGLCSLILEERVNSPSVVSRLILKWCNPAADSDYFKQAIGCTLEVIVKLPDGEDQLEGAVLITLQAIVKAPNVSPLSEVNVDNIAKFLISLCKTSQKGALIQQRLAISICRQMTNEPANIMNSIYSKMLLWLDVPDDEIVLKDLLKLCYLLKLAISNRQILYNVSKFRSALKIKMDKKEADGDKEEVNGDNIDHEEEEDDQDDGCETEGSESN